MTEEKFGQIIELYRESVFRTAYCFTKSYADAEDISQEVFLKLYTYSGVFASDEHIKAWLLRCTVNLCKNLAKSYWYRFSQSIDETAEGIACPEEKESILPEIMKLKPKLRTALYMYYFEEYSVKELSELLGESKTVITTRLSRGRSKLKELLLKEGYYEL